MSSQSVEAVESQLIGRNNQMVDFTIPGPQVASLRITISARLDHHDSPWLQYKDLLAIFGSINDQL